MSSAVGLAKRLAPDSINRLERAAEKRFEDADKLVSQKRYLIAIYLFGYSVEMCLAAAYFQSIGFSRSAPIERETRQRRMAQARQIRTAAGEPLMNSDPHPLVGWACALQWQRSSSRNLNVKGKQRLQEAVDKAELVYKHWRPELRYKIADATIDQVDEVRKVACWFIEQRGRL